MNVKTRKHNWWLAHKDDPVYTVKRKAIEKEWRRRNRVFINFRLKCLKAGVRVTISQARVLLGSVSHTANER